MQIELPYNFDFRKYQEDIWFDERKNKVLVIHRRAGKTSLAINKLIYEAILNPDKVYWYIAPTYEMAKNIIWTAPNMLNKFLPMEAVDKKNEQSKTIFLKNGAQIHLKGADKPESLAGTNPYGIIIDEFAQVKKTLYDEILAPILYENGGWVWMIGTPRKRNNFYDRYNIAAANPDWQAVILRASKSGIIPDDKLALMRKDMPERAYLQEMECEFGDSDGVVFRRVKENIEDCLSGAIAGHSYSVGVDLARLVDYTSITVLDRHTFKIVYQERFNQIDWNLQKARIEAVARRYNNAKLKVDQTGVGDSIVEDLKRIGLTVEGIKFNNTIKRDLIDNLVINLEQDKIKIPNVDYMIDELLNFSCDVNENTGTVKYAAPQGLHDDVVISLALALYQETKLATPALNTRKTIVNIKYDKFGRPSIG